jgi:hypothetical protein
MAGGRYAGIPERIARRKGVRRTIARGGATTSVLLAAGGLAERAGASQFSTRGGALADPKPLTYE